MRYGAILAVLLVSSASVAAPPKPKLGGMWDSPAGLIEIKQKGDKISGVIAEPSPDCPFAKGEEVVKGELMEDTLTGEVRYCVFAPKCGTGAAWSFAVLLSDSKSTNLSGSGTAEDKCAKGEESVVLNRSQAKKKQDPVGLKQAAGTYDPRAANNPAEKAKTLLEDGGNYLNEGQFEKARKRFEQAIALAPNIPEAYNGMGVTYYARSQYDEALEWYKKALRTAPEFGDAYYNMACIYALQNKSALALDYLTLAMLNGYKDWSEMKKDHDLDSLTDEAGYQELLKMQ